MTTLHTTLITALAVLALLATLHVGVAFAHTGSYCGHRQSGIFWTETYRGYANSGGNHWHKYEHRDWYDLRFRHYRWRVCN